MCTDSGPSLGLPTWTPGADKMSSVSSYGQRGWSRSADSMPIGTRAQSGRLRSSSRGLFQRSFEKTVVQQQSEVGLIRWNERALAEGVQITFQKSSRHPIGPIARPEFERVHGFRDGA